MEGNIEATLEAIEVAFDLDTTPVPVRITPGVFAELQVVEIDPLNPCSMPTPHVRYVVALSSGKTTARGTTVEIPAYAVPAAIESLEALDEIWKDKMEFPGPPYTDDQRGRPLRKAIAKLITELRAALRRVQPPSSAPAKDKPEPLIVRYSKRTGVTICGDTFPQREVLPTVLFSKKKPQFSNAMAERNKHEPPGARCTWFVRGTRGQFASRELVLDFGRRLAEATGVRVDVVHVDPQRGEYHASYPATKTSDAAPVKRKIVKTESPLATTPGVWTESPQTPVSAQEFSYESPISSGRAYAVVPTAWRMAAAPAHARHQETRFSGRIDERGFSRRRRAQMRRRRRSRSPPVYRRARRRCSNCSPRALTYPRSTACPDVGSADGVEILRGPDKGPTRVYTLHGLEASDEQVQMVQVIRASASQWAAIFYRASHQHESARELLRWNGREWVEPEIKDIRKAQPGVNLWEAQSRVNTWMETLDQFPAEYLRAHLRAGVLLSVLRRDLYPGSSIDDGVLWIRRAARDPVVAMAELEPLRFSDRTEMRPAFNEFTQVASEILGAMRGRLEGTPLAIAEDDLPPIPKAQEAAPAAKKPQVAPFPIVASAGEKPSTGRFRVTAEMGDLLRAVDYALDFAQNTNSTALLTVVDGKLFVAVQNPRAPSEGASRLDLEVRSSNGDEPASVVVPLIMFRAKLAEVSGEWILLELDESTGKLQIAHDGEPLSLATMKESFDNPLDNPFSKRRLWERSFAVLPQGALRLAFDSVFYAAKDVVELEKWRRLHGVYVDTTETGTRLVALDGHRMAIAKLSLELTRSGLFHHADIFGLMSLLSAGSPSNVLVWHVYTKGDDVIHRWTSMSHGISWTITVQAMRESFPDYKRLLPNPDEAKDVCTISPATLEKSIIDFAEGLDDNMLILKVGGSRLSLENPDGTKSAKIRPWTCAQATKRQRRMAINWNYVAEPLLIAKASGVQEITIALFEKLEPIVIRYDVGDIIVGEIVTIISPMKVPRRARKKRSQTVPAKRSDNRVGARGSAAYRRGLVPLRVRAGGLHG